MEVVTGRLDPPAAWDDRFGEVVADVVTEVVQQVQLWGDEARAPERWLAYLLSELGEAAEGHIRPGRKGHGYRDELVQVAAVAIRAVRDHDRKVVVESREGSA